MVQKIEVLEQITQKLISNPPQGVLLRWELTHDGKAKFYFIKRTNWSLADDGEGEEITLDALSRTLKEFHVNNKKFGSRLF